ncbi:hypothetical protein [Salinithrix halophila]|uniref:Uncharacterized protein n=1 Tax=Salinithrix halophila TaxID=1485204 RepID=A0ABV8JCX3_9BACL
MAEKQKTAEVLRTQQAEELRDQTAEQLRDEPSPEKTEKVEARSDRHCGGV